MFDMNQLRCYSAIAKERHFNRAAARRYIILPPLGRKIQLMETNMGF